MSASYSAKVFKEQGGDKFVVKSGGGIQILTGGAILNNAGAQAALTTAPAATAATNSTPYGYSQAQADAIVTWVRAVDTALKNVGIIASA